MANKPEAVIFDADGTLCDVRPIRHYVEGEVKNFAAFHKASAFCEPNAWVVEDARNAQRDGKIVLVVTGRSKHYRLLTEKWLRVWDVPVDELHTRADGDFRKDVVVKKEILDDLRSRYTVVHAWDDNPAIVELWESEGIPVTVVPGWDA